MLLEQKPRFLKGENVINIIIGLLAMYMFIVSSGYGMEARRFPQVVTGTVMFICIALAFKNTRDFMQARKRHESEGGPETKSKNKVMPKERKGQYNWLLIFLIGLLYVAVVTPLGFIIATLLVMITVPLILGYKKHLVTVPLAFVLTIGLYWLFTAVFYVPLPKGLFGF